MGCGGRGAAGQRERGAQDGRAARGESVLRVHDVTPSWWTGSSVAMIGGRPGSGVGLAALSRLRPLVYGRGLRRCPAGAGMYEHRRPSGRCATGHQGLIVMAVDELRPPLTERLLARRQLFLDVGVAVLLAAASSAQIAVSDQASPAGPGWTVARYLAVSAACGALPFRSRFPAPVLGAVAVVVALLNALAGA